MRSIQISSAVIHAIAEAGKLNEAYISLGFASNCLIIAVQSIRGYIAIVGVRPTSHPNFLVRITRDLLLESLNGGFITVDRVSDKNSCITTYRDAEISDKISVLEFPSSYSDIVESVTSLVNRENLIQSKLQVNLFSSEVQDLLSQTGTSLSYGDKWFYSHGNGIGFYIPIEEGCEKINFDLDTLKLLSKSVKGVPEFYVNASKHTYLCKKDNSYYTWRSEYNQPMDLSVILGIEPVSEFDIAIPLEMPMTVNRKFTKAKDIKYTDLDIIDGSYTNETDSYKLIGKFKTTNKTNDSVVSIRINALYLKYLVSSFEVHVKVYPKFIRVQREYSLLDIACNVVLQ